MVDPAVGEWRERIDPPGEGRSGPWPTAHLWKCPYHNGRACLEVGVRAARLRRRLRDSYVTGRGASSATGSVRWVTALNTSGGTRSAASLA